MANYPVDSEPEYPIFQSTPDGPRVVYRQAVAEPNPHRGGFSVYRSRSRDHIRHFLSFDDAQEFAKQVTRGGRRAPRANPI